MNSIKLQNLSFAYRKDDYLIKNLNLELTSGFSLLIGPTGCGKSTLLKIIAGLYPKYAGKMHGRVSLNGMSKAMMFQNAGEQFTMATPREEIIFALENLQLSEEEYEERLKKAVIFTQISKLLDQKIITLSGGEKQRVALAVLVAMDVDLFLLDEPFASCDPEARKFLINKLAELRTQGKMIVISDHVFDDYNGVCDQVYQMKNGQIFEINEQEQAHLFQKTTKHYSFALPDESQETLFTLDQTVLKQKRTLLKQDKLKIYAGKNVLITGPNGVGKTSFFKALTKMIPYSGSLQFQGKEIANLKARKYLRHVAQIFQSADDQFLKVTVRDELELSKKDRNQFFTDQRIDTAVAKLGLTDHLDQVVYSLSGGQKKKLQILLMLISQHEVLLIDEPLAGLDQQSAKQVIALMREAQKSLSQSFLIISHQTDVLADFCDYHLLFANQKLRYVSEVEE